MPSMFGVNLNYKRPIKEIKFIGYWHPIVDVLKLVLEEIKKI